MNIIVNADKNWAIGKNNSLLVRIPADMKYFRQMTEGNIVVMGHRADNSRLVSESCLKIRDRISGRDGDHNLIFTDLSV